MGVGCLPLLLSHPHHTASSWHVSALCLGFPNSKTTPHMSQSLTLLWNAPALALIALIVSHE